MKCDTPYFSIKPCRCFLFIGAYWLTCFTPYLDKLFSSVLCLTTSEDDDKLSQLWITDPISEVSDKIPLKDNDLAKGPNDIYLILDGIFFTVGVEKNDVELAENCYLSIRKRVEKLYALHGSMQI